MQWLALLLLGALAVFGFAPFYFYPATILSLMGLSYFWFKASAHLKPSRQATKIGFVYGLGLHIAGTYWIYISLHDFGNMPAIMAALATFLLCAFMALFVAAVGYISLRFFNKNMLHLAISIAALWALSDWVRSWIFTGFPWLTMGYSQVPNSPLAGYAPVIGIYGVSLITVLIAGFITILILTKKRLVSPLFSQQRFIVIASVIALIIGGALLKLVAWSKPVGEPISVTLLQGNIAQNLKWAPEITQQTLQRYLTMAEQSSAKLIVMPETALPLLYSDLPVELTQRLKQHAIKNQGDILLGVVELENNEYFNSTLSIGSAQTQTYRKSHLVPFGEFIPFKAVFGWIYRDWLNMPLSDLSRGSIHQQPMKIAGASVAVNICYEDVFGEEIIRQLPAAGLLVNVSNDAWYGDSLAAYQHLQFSQARALETARMMLRATNTGATAIIDTKGNVLQHAPHFSQTQLNGFAQTHLGTTPYVRFGNWLFLMVCAGLLGALFIRRKL